MTKSLLFSCTLLVSSALVFLVEFTCAKMVLPLLGGSPAVWNTCLVFFQAGLVLGYAYAHVVPGLLGVRWHALLHLGLWLLAGCVLLLMPLNPAEAAVADPPPGEPIFWLLRLLTVSIGFPFVLLASCGPLVQRWFAGYSGVGTSGPLVPAVSCGSSTSGPLVPTGHGGGRANPYFLYTASNLGSLLGLVLYPFVIEPRFKLSEQNQAWMWVFFVLAGLLTACACWLMTPVSRDVPGASLPRKRGVFLRVTPPAYAGGSLWPLRLRWVLLALAPSSLMLSVTSYLTTDIAPIPLLWMLPMALYLGSFVLVFGWQNTTVQANMARWLPAVLVLVVIVMLAEGTEPILLVMAIHLLGFFWIALVCHGELARSKPAAEHLTEFYLWLAVGGVLGGMVNALAAPLLFNGIVEYPLMMVLAGWLNPGEYNLRAHLPGRLEFPSSRLDLIAPMLVGLLTAGLVLVVGALLPPGQLSAALMFVPPGILCLLAAAHPARFSLCLAGLLLASALYAGVHGRPVLRVRSFFGVHRVTEVFYETGGSDGSIDGYRLLVHGSTVHGMQSLDPERRKEPLTYYHKDGPIGQFFEMLKHKDDPRLERVGLIGLGTGALACYSRLGEHWTFFEIDPAVKRIAQDPKLFTFLFDHRKQVDVILGDGRLTLKQMDDASSGGLGQPLAGSDRFGVLVVDAFGSDSIPLHLLTREALAIYRQRLRPGGVIAFHISNRYFDLEPILANLAREAGWTCKISEDGEGDTNTQRYRSTWVFLAESPSHLAGLATADARGDARLQPWTDDFSNVVQILKWK